jgi:SAM-dependent methyltransferase
VGDERVRACAWCGAPIGARARRAPGGAACAKCGAATTDPVPSELELTRSYSSWYRPASGRFSGIGDRVLARSRATLATRLDAIAPAGPILDVGSGDGSLLAALRRRGREAVGVERDAQGEGVVGADVRELDREFAAIVFWHSLEHLRDAGEVLAHASALLGPGGVIAIAMPNSGSLQARAFGDRWLALDFPRHLVHVPAPALLERLRVLDLRVERTSYWRGGQVVFGWLHGLVGLLPGRPSLYDAIRRPEARSRTLTPSGRAATLLAAAALAPAAAAAAAIEVIARRGGTTYVEARRTSTGPGRAST